jgi:excisionase family DNA binding protein
MAKTNYSTWLTKQQAADAIGVSTKTIEQLAQRKAIHQEYWKRPETGAKVSVYHPEDVERERKARNPDAEPFVLPEAGEDARSNAQGAAVAIRQPSIEQFMQAIAGAVSASQNSQNAGVRTTERLFLTISDAADYSGLPQAHLRRLMKDGKLEGLKTGGGWRIRRADLERL